MNTPKVAAKMLTLEVAVIALFVIPAGIYAASTLNTTLTSNKNLSAENGLVGHWTFDGPDMLQSVVDSSGSGELAYLGNNTSTTTVAGPVGSALSFNGSTSHLKVGAVNIQTDSTITYSMWVYENSRVSGGGDPATAHIIYSANGGASSYNEISSDDGVLKYVTGGSWASTGYTLPLREWTHLVFVLSGANLSIYADGVLQVSKTDNDFNTRMFPIVIGAWANNSHSGTADSGFFDGVIDDVRVYNRLLSAAEVKRLYDLGGTTYLNTTVNSNPATSPSASSGLVGYWTFDGPNLLQNVGDSSGLGKIGFLTNFSSTSTSITAGKLGQGLSFDGVSEHIQIFPPVYPAGDFTYALWTRLRANTDETLVMIPDVSGANEFIMYVGADNKLQVGTNNTAFTSFNTSMPVGEWIHVAVTRSGSTITAYINGEADGTRTDGTALDLVCRLYLGVDIDPGGCSSALENYLSGSLDDVRIYNRALTGAEVKRLYQLGL